MSGCARKEPARSSLAAELTSMSAGDWAARLFAADAGRLSCPLLDCFASLPSSGAALHVQARQVSLRFTGPVWLTSCPFFLPPSALKISLSSPSLLPGRLPLATASLHQMAEAGGRG